MSCLFASSQLANQLFVYVICQPGPASSAMLEMSLFVDVKYFGVQLERAYFPSLVQFLPTK